MMSFRNSWSTKSPDFGFDAQRLEMLDSFFLNLELPNCAQIDFINNSVLQKATAAMPCASTAKRGGF